MIRPPVIPVEKKIQIVFSVIQGEISVADAARREQASNIPESATMAREDLRENTDGAERDRVKSLVDPQRFVVYVVGIQGVKSLTTPTQEGVEQSSEGH